MTVVVEQAPPASAVAIRPATADDAGAIFALITENLTAGHLLARPLGEVELHVPRFFVAVEDADVVGCGELARLGPTVAEIRSLVTVDRRRGEGIGSRLLEALVEDALSRRVPRVCAFTHQPRPFVKAGFSIVPHPWVPAKIATDCEGCELFRCCDRYAVVRDLPVTSDGGRW